MGMDISSYQPVNASVGIIFIRKCALDGDLIGSHAIKGQWFDLIL